MVVLIVTERTADAQAALAAAGLGGRGEVEPDLTRALERLETERWGLVVLDAGLAGGASLDLIQPLSSEGRAVVVAAGQPTLALTLRALRSGAVDVVPFPPPAQRLRELVADALGAPAPSVPGAEAEAWIGSSPALLEAFRSAVRLAATDVPVLIRGEPGTGRERLARVIHEASERASGPWLAVNCGAIPEPVLESELFGHERGAGPGVFGRRVGRFVRATGGTLYLAELDRLSARVQQRVEQIVRTGTVEPRGAAEPVAVDTRLVAGVELDPRDLERQGVMLPSLWAALAPGLIELPPLRERGEADIRALVQHFVAEFGARFRKPVGEVAEDAWSALLRHTWPGNVRQLRGAIERAVIHVEAGVVHARHLPADVTATAERLASEQSLRLEDVEKRHILRVLDLMEGHVGRTAEILGIHRNTLSRKLRGYGVESDRTSD